MSNATWISKGLPCQLQGQPYIHHGAWLWRGEGTESLMTWAVCGALGKTFNLSVPQFLQL